MIEGTGLIEHELHERDKELSMLHTAVRLLLNTRERPPVVLAELVRQLPTAWNYPEITVARVSWDGHCYASPHFRATPWGQHASVELSDGRRAAIDVYYTESRPEKDEGPFLTEERRLLDSLSYLFADYLERVEIATTLHAERNEAERERAARDESILGALAEGVIVTDLEGRLLIMNRAAYEHHGVSRSLREGHRFAEFEGKLFYADGREVPVGDWPLARVLRGEIVDRAEFEFVLPGTSHRRLIRYSGAQIRDAQDTPILAVVMSTDVTELRTAEHDRYRLALMEERSRLGRELHDTVAQVFFSIGLQAHAGQGRIATDPTRSVKHFDEIIRLAEAGVAETRALVFDMRPDSLQSEGLVAALQRQAGALRARGRLEVKEDLGMEPEAPLAVKEALYRVAQEAMQNMFKHAHATHARIRLAIKNRHLVLELHDDGMGFDLDDLDPGTAGFRMIRQRVEGLGGTLRIDSHPGKGTQIVASVPLGT